MRTSAGGQRPRMADVHQTVRANYGKYVQDTCLKNFFDNNKHKLFPVNLTDTSASTKSLNSF